jgi:hypothetical protein
MQVSRDQAGEFQRVRALVKFACTKTLLFG